MYLWDVHFINLKEKEWLGVEKVVANSDQDAILFGVKAFENNVTTDILDTEWEKIKSGEVKAYPKMVTPIDEWKEK